MSVDLLLETLERKMLGLQQLLSYHALRSSLMPKKQRRDGGGAFYRNGYDLKEGGEMTVLKKAVLTIAASVLLASCSSLSSLTSSLGSANDKTVAEATIAKTIKTKDLYGAWAVADDDPIDFLYVVVLTPNHIGLNFLTIDEKDGKPESRYSEYYSWEFNEKDKIFTSHAVKRKTIEKGQPEIEEDIQETDHYETTLYMDGDKPLAIRFVKPDEKYTFIRMSDEMYYRMVEGIPDIPSLK